MNKIDLHNISRRAFVIGGGAALFAGGLGLSGCGSSTANVPVLTKDEILNAAVSYKLVNMTPVSQTGATAIAAGWHIFQSLYHLDLRTYTTSNELATSDPVMVSPRKYEIALREDIKFSNGEQFSSADVVNAFDLNLRDANYKSFFDFMESYQADGPYKFVITTKYDNYNLIKERLSIIKIFPKSLTEEQLKQNPIGSGPYRLVSYEPFDGGEVKFEPNPNYIGDFPAQTAGMNWQIVTDPDSRSQLLSQKKVDAIEACLYSKVDLLKSSGASVAYEEGITAAHLIFNTVKKPFDDPRVRQAIFYAIDSSKILNNYLLDQGSLATAYVPNYHSNYHRASNVFEYNPDKARQLLSQAGYPNFEFELLVYDSWVKYFSDSIANDLAKVGIKINVVTKIIDWSTLSYSGKNIPQYDVALVASDPSVFGNDIELISRWWYADNAWTRERSAWKFSAPEKWAEFQEYLKNAVTAKDIDKQGWWNKCIDLISEQVPSYPLVFGNNSSGIYADIILDYTPIAATGLNFLKCRMAKRDK